MTNKIDTPENLKYIARRLVGCKGMDDEAFVAEILMTIENIFLDGYMTCKKIAREAKKLK